MNAVKSAYNNSDKPLGDIDFFALAGHICRLCEPKEYEKWNGKWEDRELPMVPSTFKVQASNTKKVRDLKEKLKTGNYDAIIVGTDSDVEGNGIYDFIEQYLGLQNKKAYRFFESDMTPAGIMRSIRNLTDYHTNQRDVGMTEAFRIRSRFDWLVGFNMSVAYTLKCDFLMKVGRVKAPTLKLVYDNCKAIDSFTAKTSYQPGIRTESPEVEALMVDEEGKAVSFQTDKEASDVFRKLSGVATVEEFSKTKKKTNPDQLYKLTDIQYEAGKKYGYTPEKTLELIQSLYEKKLISYPRTDGRYVSTEKAKDFPRILKAVLAVPEFSGYSVSNEDIRRTQGDSRYVNDKEVQKSSHDALIPTGETAELNKISKDERNICMMIFSRFLAIFLPPLVEEKSKAVLSDNGNFFACTGSKVIDPGYSVLFSQKKEAPLPELKKGQKLREKETFLHEIVAKPPERYTQASLIKAMENVQKNINDETLKAAMKRASGIGQPSSRASIISELVSTGYVEDVTKGKGKGLHITDKGIKYIENLKGSSIISPELTAQWEIYMDDIRKGEATFDEVYGKVLDYVKEAVKEAESMKRNDEVKVGICPKCGGSMISGSRSFKCDNYPKCFYTIYKTIAGRTLSNKEGMELLTNGKTGKLDGFRRKDGSMFSASLVLDAEGKVGFASNQEETGYKCPKCGKPLIKMTYAYRCKDNECGFKLWSSPGGKTLTESQIKTLLEGGKTEIIRGFKTKDGKKFDAILGLENGALKYYYPGADSGMKCPKCGKTIVESEKSFFCQDKDGCGFRIWRGLPGGKKSLSKKDLKDLLTNGKTEVKKGLVSKAGNEFSASIVLKDDFSTGFEFEKRKQE